MFPSVDVTSERRDRRIAGPTVCAPSTYRTGRNITAAALILLVVTGAFAFSDLVMMQYIAYGMASEFTTDTGRPTTLLSATACTPSAAGADAR
ncbi:hypothetical protein AB0I35_24230 [Nocardia sp. NPDC050378]|uniref:hypothetical protein n=1 Tax=Nocardia sp. NPDC050378 TaxID=3155400 RepID=UPI0033C61165